MSLDITGRVERLIIEAREHEHRPDALLVYTPVNVRYLTGFTGSHGLVVIDVSGRLAGHCFLTDFRYKTQSAEQVSGDLYACEVIDNGKLLEAVVETLKKIPRGGRLGFDDAHTTVAQHEHLGELLSEDGDEAGKKGESRGKEEGKEGKGKRRGKGQGRGESQWELISCGGLVERLRLVKEPDEIERIHAAAKLADEALRTSVLQRGVVGRTEREVAIDLELAMRRLGAEPSFPSIVASGAHGALPHAQARNETISSDVLVTIDWGALLDGYCSDCTRTYATGENVSARAREVYELVRSVQATALAAVHAGPNGVELDRVARDLIEAAGHGEEFGHGLGHGVGMEVHEGPRLSRTAPEDPIQAGSVVTVEPGVYVPGECGVRIEDLVVVRADGHDVLTGLPTELTVIS